MRYPFVLLGEERHCEDKCLIQDHNKTTLTKALTQTVDPEFKARSFKLAYSCLLMSSDFPSTNFP